MLYSIEEKGEVANQRGGWMHHIGLTGGEPEWCMVLPRWADSNQNQTPSLTPTNQKAMPELSETIRSRFKP